MQAALSRLLAFKRIGIIRFARDLGLVDVDAQARRMLDLPAAGVGVESLPDLFPELIGNEASVRNVLAGKRIALHLEYVNRRDRQGELRFLDLLVLAGERKNEGLLAVEDVSEKGRMLQELTQQRHELLLYRNAVHFREHLISEAILGRSPAIEKVRRMIRKISRVPSATVLLSGESGTGKNLAARVIHHSSMPAEAPFVEINCAALPDNLMEAELFGYEKGAFTNALSTRAGLLQEAGNGTVLLDEIGELTVPLQAKLLSVLEEHKVRRLGSNREVEIRARIIAATNRDLEREVSAGRFRQDLFYRLHVVAVRMPALREMDQDVLQIAEHLLKVFAIEFKKKSVRGFTPAARKRLLNHSWPGNVRELRNCIERAMIFTESQRIDADELTLLASRRNPARSLEIPPEGLDLEAVERQLIGAALQRSGRNKSRAAQLLGLSRDTLRYRLKKYGMG